MRPVRQLVRKVFRRIRGQLGLTLDGFAHVEQDEGHRRPALGERNVEQRPDDTAGVLRDVARVGYKRKVFDVRLRDVRLEEDVDFAGTAVGAAADLARARRLHELLQLLDLVLADLNLLKLDARGDQGEDVRLAHARAEHLVEDLDTRVADVVTCGDPTEIGGREGSEVLVEFDHLDFDEALRGVVHQGVALAAEQRVLFDFGGRHAVQERVLAHANEEIGVAEPSNAFVHVRHGAEADLGVEGVDEACREPVQQSVRRDLYRVTC